MHEMRNHGGTHFTIRGSQGQVQKIDKVVCMVSFHPGAVLQGQHALDLFREALLETDRLDRARRLKYLWVDDTSSQRAIVVFLRNETGDITHVSLVLRRNDAAGTLFFFLDRYSGSPIYGKATSEFLESCQFRVGGNYRIPSWEA